MRGVPDWLSGQLLWRWPLFLAASALAVSGLRFVQVPAAVMLGCLGTAVFVGIRGWGLRLPPILFLAAQGIIGCMIARTLRVSVFAEIARDWHILMGTVVAVIGVSILMGWVLARRGVLPGTTAMWGVLPGGATALVLMAESHGGDSRLVALMQYTRVAMVALVASVVSWVWVGPVSAPSAFTWFAPVNWPAFAGTLAITVLGGLMATRVRMAAGGLLIPMIMGAVVQNTTDLSIELPSWLLAMSFAIVGWSVGFRFTPGVLKHCLKALPSVMLSVCLLLAICGGLAVLLTYFAGIDPLTAYLATSPGGVDSIAIIAASAPVNMPFIVALQTLRFILILVLGPLITKAISRHLAGKP